VEVFRMMHSWRQNHFLLPISGEGFFLPVPLCKGPRSEEAYQGRLATPVLAGKIQLRVA
jgi:hypothetical protein